MQRRAFSWLWKCRWYSVYGGPDARAFRTSRLEVVGWAAAEVRNTREFCAQSPPYLPFFSYVLYWRPGSVFHVNIHCNYDYSISVSSWLAVAYRFGLRRRKPRTPWRNFLFLYSNVFVSRAKSWPWCVETIFSTEKLWKLYCCVTKKTQNTKDVFFWWINFVL